MIFGMEKYIKSRKIVPMMEKHDIFTIGLLCSPNHSVKIWGSVSQYNGLYKLILTYAIIVCFISHGLCNA